MTHAFLRTLANQHVTYGSDIENWNGQDGRGTNYHYKKMQKKFPEYTFDSLPKILEEQETNDTATNTYRHGGS